MSAGSTLRVKSTVRRHDTFFSQTSVAKLSANPSVDEEAAQVKSLICTGRQYWKTTGSQGEAIWPPHVEIALLEGDSTYFYSELVLDDHLGLEQYENTAWGTILTNRRPLRNIYLAEFIKKSTGVARTMRQISSRLQHLRDTCQAQSIIDLIVRSKPEPTVPSRSPTPTRRRGANPYPRAGLPTPRLPSPHPIREELTPPPIDSADVNTRLELQPLCANVEIVHPQPIRPMQSWPMPSFLSQLRTPSAPQSRLPLIDFASQTQLSIPKISPNSRPSPQPLFTFFNVDVLLDDLTHTSSVPLIPLGDIDDVEPLQISASSSFSTHGRFCFDTVLQLVSPFRLLPKTVFSVFLNGCHTPIYTETTMLSCNSFPICHGSDWFYTVSLVPGFWNALSASADPRDYFVEQTILELRPSSCSSWVHEPTPINIRYKFQASPSVSIYLDALRLPSLAEEVGGHHHSISPLLKLYSACNTGFFSSVV